MVTPTGAPPDSNCEAAVVPKIYYRKNAGPWLSRPGNLSSGTSTNGTWSFTIVAADMGGLAVNDQVYYFIIAQDKASPANVGSTPGGVVASDVNTITTYPATPATYLIGAILSGTYTVGTGGTYSTLTSAVNAYNNGCLTGAVTFNLVSTNYDALETFPVAINANADASATNTLTIKPATGITAMITGSATNIIKLNGADYVTIDGSNNGTQSRNLSIENLSTAASSVLWVASMGGAGNGANNNTLKNLIVTGGSITTSGIYGIVSSASTATGTAAEDNNNLTIQNDSVTKVYTGISVLTSATAGLSADGLVITRNTVGNETDASTSLGGYGILVSNATAPVISLNTITNINRVALLNITGLDIGANVTNGQVIKNKIRGIRNTDPSGYAAFGIHVSSGTGVTNLLIANNFISDIASVSYTVGSINLYNTFGIRLTGGTGIKLYYNSINLFGPVSATSSSSYGLSADVVVSGAITDLDVRDNIFANTQDFNKAGSFAYNIYLDAVVTNGTFNYNDYWGNTTGNTTYRVGYGGGSPRNTLADWQAFTTQDANSKNVDPVFNSDNDLHISSSSGINNQALPLAAVTDDIDGQARDGGAPDIGADELPSPTCTGAIGGTASPANAIICVSGSIAITASGFSTGIGSGYQWQSSPDNTNWTDITGQTNPSGYNTGTITTTTYYRLKVTCTSGTAIAYSSTVTANIKPNPTVTVSPAGPISICEPATQLLSVTATSANSPSYQWRVGGADLTGQTTSSYTASVSGNYSVKVTDGATGCFIISTPVTVTINPQPAAVTVTPSSTVVCPNSSAVALTASGGTVAGVTILSEDFNGTAPGWTTVNNTTGGSDPSAPAWTLRPSPYTYSAFTTYSSNDNTQFYLSNSEAGGSGNNTSTILQSPAFSTVGYTFATLSFYHYYRDWDATDFAHVEISTNGTTWNTLDTYTTLQGGSTNFTNIVLDLNAYLGQPTVYIRFRYEAIWSYAWAIDNVSITGDQTTNFTWSPATGLYTNAAATTPYTGGNTATVYALPSSTTVYTATARSAANCTNSGTTTVNYNTAVTNTTQLAGTTGGPQVCGNYNVSTSNNYFKDCKIIATVTPSGAAPVSGNINVCVKIDGAVQSYNNQPYVQRHYDIEPATNRANATATVTLYFTQTEFDAYNAANGALPDLPTGPSDNAGKANLHITQLHGTATGPGPTNYPGPAVGIDPADANIVWNASAGRWEVTFNVTGFSGFYVTTGTNLVLLPVSLVSFNAQRSGAVNNITWSTSQETNTSMFVIERSVDGRTFTQIGQVAAAGNSNTLRNYQFTDASPVKGINYYRLQITDRDGNVKYSEIRSVKNSAGADFAIYPNPVRDVMKVEITADRPGKGMIIITDVSGKQVYSGNVNVVPGNNVFNIDISSMAQGAYIIKVQLSDDMVVKKFAKM